MTLDSSRQNRAWPGATMIAASWPAVFFVAATIWVFWPAAAKVGDHVFVTPGALQADSYLITWVMAWDCHALWTAPWQLFDANSFYPARNTLAGSEHMLGHLPLFCPAYAITGNPSLAIQLTRLATIAMCGIACFALLRHWGCGVGAALFGGFVYAFCPTRYLTVHALQLVAMAYLPLVLIYVDRVLDRGRRRDVLVLALVFALQMLCSFYLAYIAVIAVGVYVLVSILFRRRDESESHWGWLAVGLLAGIVVMVVSALPYANLAQRGEIPEQEEALLASFSARPWATYATRPRIERFGKLGDAYVGIVPAILGISAILGAWRRRVRPAALAAALGLAATMYLLALGPHVDVGGLRVPMPYQWASAIVPGFSSMRVPLRFTFGFVLGMATLAGLGMQSILASQFFEHRRVVATVLLGGCVVATAWDYGHFDYRVALRRVIVPETLPPVYRALREREAGPLLELPVAIQGEAGFAALDREARYQYMSVFHWFPLLNGYTGYAPGSAATVKRIARSLPGERPLRLLRRVTDLRYVIVHRGRLAEDLRDRWLDPPGLRRVGVFGDDLLFEVEGHVEGDLVASLASGIEMDGRTLEGTPTAALADDEVRVRFGSLVPDLSDRVVAAGLPVAVRLAVENRSKQPWPVLTRDEDRRVAVQYAWHQGGEKHGEGVVDLPYDLAPGEVATMVGAVVGPRAPGRYRLSFALAQGARRFANPLEIDRVEVRPWPSRASK